MSDRATPAPQPPLVFFTDIGRRDHNTYRIHFDDRPHSVAVVDDFGCLRTVDRFEGRYPQWLNQLDHHEVCDPEDGFEAYLALQYPGYRKPVMSLARPAPIEATVEREPADSWVTATIQIDRDARSIDAPFYEIVLPGDSLQLTHGQAAALLVALQELVQPVTPELAS